MYASYSKLSKELKNSITIKVGQAVLELLIQTSFWLFDPLAYISIQLWVPWTIYYKMHNYVLFQGVDYFEIEHKTW